MKRLFAALAVAITAASLAACSPVSTTTESQVGRVAVTNGSGGPLTDRLNVPFTANGITSKYHIFAAGLDWSKEVGFLLYTDGSGGYGLDNPNGTYLLDADGTNGLVAVAKKHNLLLVTPFAPAPNCDGEDNCWYNESTTPNATAKSDWARALVDSIYTQYNVEKDRVAIGGYSSGAQFTSRWFVPRHGAAIQTDGVFVPIAYGGAPAVTPNFPQSYKDKVVGSWDTGTNDEAYSTANWGAIGGYNWYRNNGFTAEALWPAGVGHARDGQFDSIMDREITQHVRPAGAATTPPPTTTTPAPAAWDHQIVPRATGATLTVDIPVPSPTVTWRMSRDPITNQIGFYDSTNAEGSDVVINTTSTLLRGTRYYYQIENGSRSNVVARGEFVTLP